MKTCPSCATVNASDAAFCIQCGFALSNVPSDAARLSPQAAAGGAYLSQGTVVDGKYEIEKVLGEGGMGVVYRARDVHTEMPVVIKSIRAELSGNDEFRARTLAEGRALARIDHPNVVRLNAVVVESRALYLVMQFIDGESLDRLIARWSASGSPMPVSLALTIFRMILHGVGAAHAEGLIHRDLKPANVLIRAKDGVAKVTDFGIAKGEDDAKAGRGMTRGIIGSLAYMAPEQVRGQRDLDKRVDIYALGILLFELLTGRAPFDAPSDYELMRMQTEAPLPLITTFRPDVPPALDAVLRRACAKDRAGRFASTDEFLSALTGIESAAGAGPQVAAPQHTARGHAHTEMATQPGAPPWAAVAPPTAPGRGSSEHPLGAVARTATQDGAAIPLKPRPTRRAGLWIGIGAAALAVAALGTTLLVSRAEPERKAWNDPPPEKTAAAPGTSAVLETPSSSPTTATTPATESPLNALVGHWRSTSNRDYAAVVSGDRVEFRIEKASQHPRQGYEDGDVRFALSPSAGSSASFAVTDYIRPTPPPGFEYDPKRSRESCVGTWTQIKGRRLTAHLEGASTLKLELALIRTGAEKFRTQGNQVVGCNDIASAPGQTTESQLTRVP